jgi:hypothetical protein
LGERHASSLLVAHYILQVDHKHLEMTDPKRQEVSLDEEDEFEEFQVEGKTFWGWFGLCARQNRHNDCLGMIVQLVQPLLTRENPRLNCSVISLCRLGCETGGPAAPGALGTGMFFC